MQSLIAKIRKTILCIAVVVSVAIPLVPAGAYAVAQTPTSTGGGGKTTDVCGTAGKRCNDFVDHYINPFILLLSALVGVVAVISIILAGIQYAGSADDPGTVSKAKQRIFNTIIGLIAYIFLFAFLSYIIPGGLF
jgi:hypothetical protein